jgi:hypothetical protein
MHAEQALRADHVGAARPQRGGRSLPAVAAVDEQRAGARRAQPLDQRGEVREAADLAVAAGQRLELKMGEGVSLSAAAFQFIFF